MAFETDFRFDLRRCVPMSRAEEHLCASEYARTKDPVLAQRLITANMRLVVKLARAYRRPCYELFDLVQEGNLGLIRAVSLFDPHRGIKLCTYAGWWIRAYILKFTLDNWRLVKAGTTEGQRRTFFSLQKQKQALERQGIQADAKTLAAVMQVREADVVGMLERFSAGETSLETPRGSHSDASAVLLMHTLRAPDASRPDVRVEASDLASALKLRLATIEEGLRGRELAIFRRRLLNEEPATLAALAVEFGVSRERARQVEARLKERIRQDLKATLGTDLDLDDVPTRPRRLPPGPAAAVSSGAVT